MRRLMIAAGAAMLLVASSIVALADGASGSISSIDEDAMSITLEDGTTYLLPEDFDIEFDPGRRECDHRVQQGRQWQHDGHHDHAGELIALQTVGGLLRRATAVCFEFPFPTETSPNQQPKTEPARSSHLTRCDRRAAADPAG